MSSLDVCGVKGCCGLMEKPEIMCSRHWEMVNPALKNRLVESYAILPHDFKMWTEKAITNAEQIEKVRKI